MKRSNRSPVASSATVRAVMQGNRRRDTAPEVRLRSALHRAGLRFRVDHVLEVGGMRARPDIVFPRARLAVFIDGCFWHGCPAHGTRPRRNSGYWDAKLQRNRARDSAQSAALRREGWTVLRIWEHVPVERAARRVAAALERRRAVPRS